MITIKYPALCSTCVKLLGLGSTLRQLSGYSLWSMRCDGCGHYADLAMCKLKLVSESMPTDEVNPTDCADDIHGGPQSHA
jgi:hypothetical protein